MVKPKQTIVKPIDNNKLRTVYGLLILFLIWLEYKKKPMKRIPQRKWKLKNRALIGLNIVRRQGSNSFVMHLFNQGK